MVKLSKSSSDGGSETQHDMTTSGRDADRNLDGSPEPSSEHSKYIWLHAFYHLLVATIGTGTHHNISYISSRCCSLLSHKLPSHSDFLPAIPSKLNTITTQESWDSRSPRHSSAGPVG